jgi:glutaredoxin
MAKKFLDDNKVPYQDLDVAQDKEARAEMVKRSGQLGVPVIDVDGELIIGFNQAKLKEKLGIK